MKVAAVVPAYNEETTIGQVVKILKDSKLFSEVVVVTDGSTDRTVSRAKKAGADKVVHFPFRLGKGNAMDVGVANTSAPIIFFADADLLGFKITHIKKVLEPVLNGEAA